jgi:indolepyruvate ferredoxin oxidoreductase beta subunit
MQFNLVVAGVGGQGSIIASHIIAEAAIRSNLHARVGETFGAAMRGGAVASHVRLGEVLSPLVPEDGADAVLALEPLEGLRVAVRFLRPHGAVIANTAAVPPVDVNIGAAAYPDHEQLADAYARLLARPCFLDATRLAVEAGNARAMNVVMLGALCAAIELPVSRAALEAAVAARVPPKTLEANQRAFAAGFAAVRDARAARG